MPASIAPAPPACSASWRRTAPALAGQGIVYPGEENSHQALAWALHRGQADPEAVLALVAEGRAVGARTVVLSGEDFAIHRTLGWLRAVAEHVDTRAVFYLRRQDHWLMSWYNQHVKWPFNREKSRMDPQAFLAAVDDFYWLDYEWLLGRWSAVLGEGRVAAGVLEKGQVEDTTADFLARLGVAAEGLADDQVAPTTACRCTCSRSPATSGSTSSRAAGG